MKFLPLALPEVVLVEPDVYRDDRGFFLETYQKRKYGEAGLPEEFVQDLDEFFGEPGLSVLPLLIGLQEEATVVPVDVRLDEHHLREGQWKEFHRACASLSRFVPRPSRSRP